MLLQQIRLSAYHNQRLCDNAPWRHLQGSCNYHACAIKWASYQMHHNQKVNFIEHVSKSLMYHRGPRGGGTSKAVKPLMHWASGPSPTFSIYWRNQIENWMRETKYMEDGDHSFIEIALLPTAIKYNCHYSSNWKLKVLLCLSSSCSIFYFILILVKTNL